MGMDAPKAISEHSLLYGEHNGLDIEALRQRLETKLQNFRPSQDMPIIPHSLYSATALPATLALAVEGLMG
jgi:type VI protein secretion system component VasF